MKKHFENKVVWITGGGGGLGKALAIQFARHGAKVAVSGRRVDKLNETIQEIEKENAEAIAIKCDVSKDEEIVNAVSQIVDNFGQLDVAIANAAIPMTGKIDKLTENEWRRIYDTNVIGLALTIKHALPELLKTKGRIVLVGSVGSMVPSPNYIAYTSSKYAMRAIGQTLSIDLYKSGVTCTNIYPGYMSTEFAQINNNGKIDDSRQKWDNAFTWTAEKSAKDCMKPIYKRKREYVLSGFGKVFAWLGKRYPGFIHFISTRFNMPGLETDK